MKRTTDLNGENPKTWTIPIILYAAKHQKITVLLLRTVCHVVNIHKVTLLQAAPMELRNYTSPVFLIVRLARFPWHAWKRAASSAGLPAFALSSMLRIIGPVQWSRQDCLERVVGDCLPRHRCEDDIDPDGSKERHCDSNNIVHWRGINGQNLKGRDGQRIDSTCNRDAGI